MKMTAEIVCDGCGQKTVETDLTERPDSYREDADSYREDADRSWFFVGENGVLCNECLDTIKTLGDVGKLARKLHKLGANVSPRALGSFLVRYNIGEDDGIPF